MTAREKQRLGRFIASNATVYRDARQSLVLAVLLGAADEETIKSARWDLSHAATSIAEAVASLEDHADED